MYISFRFVHPVRLSMFSMIKLLYPNPSGSSWLTSTCPRTNRSRLSLSTLSSSISIQFKLDRLFGMRKDIKVSYILRNGELYSFIAVPHAVDGQMMASHIILEALHILLVLNPVVVVLQRFNPRIEGSAIVSGNLGLPRSYA